jgi:hypothetical protein
MYKGIYTIYVLRRNLFIWWLNIHCFTSRLRFSHSYGDPTIASEGLHNLGQCSALRPLRGEGSLSCHTCCDTGASVFLFHQKDRPIWSQLPTPKGMLRTYSNPDPHRLLWAEIEIWEEPEIYNTGCTTGICKKQKYRYVQEEMEVLILTDEIEFRYIQRKYYQTKI